MVGGQSGGKMSKGGTCLKRAAIGCGTIVVLFIVLGGLFILSARLNKPKDVDVQKIEEGYSFAVDPEGGLNLPEGQQAPTKPIFLNINASMCELQIIPGTEPGKVSITGDYDKANFELKTNVEEKSDHIEYNVDFDGTFSPIGLIFGENMDIENKIIITLPPDQIYRLQSNGNMGEFKFDLSGLAVSSIDSTLDKGQMDFKASKPNPIKMTTFKVDGKMGEVNVADIQNYGFESGDFRHRMGEMNIGNSGPLREDLNIQVRMRMGEAQVNLPNNAEIEDNTKVAFGEKRFNNGLKLPNEILQTEQADAPKFKAVVNGGSTMGAFLLSKGQSQYSLFSKIGNEGTGIWVDKLRTLHEMNPEHRILRPNVLNRLGYDLIGDGKYEDAIAIFILNVELHPSYANGYDSLADAYRRNKQLDLALVNYQKAVEMDPSNDHAARWIEKIKASEDLPKDSRTTEPKPDEPQKPEPEKEE